MVLNISSPKISDVTAGSDPTKASQCPPGFPACPHKTALHQTVQLCVSYEKHTGHSSFSASFPMEESTATWPGLANSHGCPESLPPPTPGQSHPRDAPQSTLATSPETHPDLELGKSLGGKRCQAEQGRGKAYKNQRRRKVVAPPLLPAPAST